MLKIFSLDTLLLQLVHKNITLIVLNYFLAIKKELLRVLHSLKLYQKEIFKLTSIKRC